MPDLQIQGLRAAILDYHGYALRQPLPIRDLLAAIAIFVNGAKGISPLQLTHDLDVQYKTAFVLAHKLREQMGAEIDGRRAELIGLMSGSQI